MQVEFKTSGSTGDAKRIVKTGESLAADVDTLAGEFGELLSGCAVVATVSPIHMYGKLWVDMLPKRLGLEVHPMMVESVESLVALRACYQRIVFVTTPFFLDQLLRHESAVELKGFCKAIITSGSLLGANTSQRVFDLLGVSPTEIFGSTETGTVAWRRQAESLEWTVVEGVAVSSDPQGRIVVDSPFCVERPWTMSDAVEFSDARHFTLKGRTDRNVKILGNLISLDDVEAAIVATGFAEEAHVIVAPTTPERIWALVVPSSRCVSLLKKTGYGATTRAITTALKGEVLDSAVPRRIRYLDSLPRNAQGKLPRAQTLPILKSRIQLPVVENFTRPAEDQLAAELTFPADLVCFQGHFPEFTLLPGVAQLHFVNYFARRYLSLPAGEMSISRLKFRGPIVPDVTVRLNMSRSANGAVDFSIKTLTGSDLASGRLICGA